ncbi:hypothetical protein PSYCG_04125 [Psychrobacter sp. G]|nr:hypothetical protein PSYCG_04125 [Psychrobacter sp. G]
MRKDNSLIIFQIQLRIDCAIEHISNKKGLIICLMLGSSAPKQDKDYNVKSSIKLLSNNKKDAGAQSFSIFFIQTF